MTMLRVLLQGPGSISKYGKCGCAKTKKKNKTKKKERKRKAKNEEKNRGWLMTNVVGAMAWFRVYFPIWKVWLCKKKKSNQKASNLEKK
jgi:hypothetical protein